MNGVLPMPKTILAVDDSRTMRHMMSCVLTKEGYDVMEAEDGTAAMDILANFRVDLIISDLYMPKMNGLELVKNIRASVHHKNVPIILLTTDSEQKNKEQAKSSGANGWMMKPFSPVVLIETIKKFIKA